MSYNWELIDFDPATGLKKYIGDNPDDSEGVCVRYEQDAASIKTVIDRNKESQATGFDKRSDFWHAAHIPIGVMYEWKVKHGVDAWKYSSCEETRRKVNRLLNDPDYRYLRVNNFIMETK
jgi:hypothetical protein